MRSNPLITNVPSPDARLQALEAEVRDLRVRLDRDTQEDVVSIICFSGEWDKLFAALTIAGGSLAMGKDVHLFFTFWGLNALRRKACNGNGNGKKNISQSMLARILPCGAGKARLSRLHFLGLGKHLMKREMKRNGVEDIEVLFKEVEELGAHFHICNTTAELFGLECTELSDIEKMDQCGVATFLSFAQKSRMVLFI
jgi:peroxiredoxin family protein